MGPRKGLYLQIGGKNFWDANTFWNINAVCMAHKVCLLWKELLWMSISTIILTNRLNRVISDFTTQWKATIYCDVYKPIQNPFISSNGIVHDSSHVNLRQASTGLLYDPNSQAFGNEWMILKIDDNSVIKANSKGHKKGTRTERAQHSRGSSSTT